MAEITVPREDRPSLAKYVIATLALVLLVSAFAGLLVRSAGGLFGAVVGLTAATVNLAILFVMVQSLIEDWFRAAEVTLE